MGDALGSTSYPLGPFALPLISRCRKIAHRHIAPSGLATERAMPCVAEEEHDVTRLRLNRKTGYIARINAESLEAGIGRHFRRFYGNVHMKRR